MEKKPDSFSVHDGICSGWLISDENPSNFLFFSSYFIYLYVKTKENKKTGQMNKMDNGKINVFLFSGINTYIYPESVLNIS